MGQGNGYLFCNAASSRSTRMQRLLANDYAMAIYRSPKRARRRPGKWVRAGPGFRTKLPVDWERDHIPDRAQLLARIPNGDDPVAQKWAADHMRGILAMHYRARTVHYRARPCMRKSCTCRALPLVHDAPEKPLRRVRSRRKHRLRTGRNRPTG
jgi:hypothetical protein